jgi:hypothetical protein
MHVFISRALQKILREASKKQTALRQACTDVLGPSMSHTRPLAVARSWGEPAAAFCLVGWHAV